MAYVPPLPRSIPARAVSLYENSFAVRAPKLWNCLPKSVKDAKTLDAFKSTLDEVSLTRCQIYHQSDCRCGHCRKINEDEEDEDIPQAAIHPYAFIFMCF